jgi:pimeloyl-ACP methyl ester carboxylesterase
MRQRTVATFELGSGPPLVLVPGIPGPWEYVRRTVEALAASYRVLTFSLGPECSIESDVARIGEVLDDRRLDQAIVCGISYGGLIALRFAATHPAHTRALVLASAPGPGTRLRPSHRIYTQWPYVFGPLFLAETPFRFSRELERALPLRSDRWSFHWSQLEAFLTAGVSLPKIARRARVMEALDITADCRRVAAPTLIVTGEPALDWVVPVNKTTEYLRLIRGARHVVLEGTGHLGAITQPAAFTAAVTRFLDDVRIHNDEVA